MNAKLYNEADVVRMLAEIAEAEVRIKPPLRLSIDDPAWTEHLREVVRLNMPEDCGIPITQTITDRIKVRERDLAIRYITAIGRWEDFKHWEFKQP